MEINSRLELSADEMRALGYRVVDLLVEHFHTISSIPAAVRGTRAGLEALLREPLPERPSDPNAVLEQLERDVFTHMLHVDHPRFFAFVPSPGNFIATMADSLASGFNPFVGTWLSGSGPSQVELVTIDWLRGLCLLPETAGGLFVSGGSMANLTALAVARHVRLEDRVEGAVIYFSDQTHASVDKALRVLGFAPQQVRRLPSDERCRLPLDELRRAVAEDRSHGRAPFCVVANAGTTNTGAVDPLPELRRICDAEKLWLHTDGAYGAAAMICERGRAAMAGLGEVDSLALDPHKWLFQPFEIGCVLVRDFSWLQETFTVRPDYLKDAIPAGGEVNFSDLGIQLSRSFRALKVWMSFKVFGAEAFRRAVTRGIELAETAESRLRELPCWEIVTPAELGIVSFRYAPPDMPTVQAEALNRQLIERAMADGFAMLSSTLLRGRTVLRLCTINPRTTEGDILETVARFTRLGAESAISS